MSLINNLKQRMRGDTDAYEFAPGLVCLQEPAPSPLPRLVLYTICGLFGIALSWAAVGSVDVVSVAPGKLVPQSYLKIVQPTEQGSVKEILVREGDQVRAGQILVRMDPILADADRKALESALALKQLQVQRIDAELANKPFRPAPDALAALVGQAEGLYLANRRAYQDALNQEQSALLKARQDYVAAQAIEGKLRQVVPTYREREAAFVQLGQDGFAGKLLVLDRQRERIEKEQEWTAQTAAVASLKATIQQSERRLDQVASSYRQQLQRERTEALGEVQRLEQELNKRVHRDSLLELKAPQAGMIKDLATHTSGSVVSPGTVLMTLVPTGEALQAEVWVSNDDIGFIQPQQKVKVKVATYPFQKYGLLSGKILTVGADATDPNSNGQKSDGQPRPGTTSNYKAIVVLDRQELIKDGKHYGLSPGMTISGEIALGDRTVLDYLLSPIQKTTLEAARER